MDKAKIRNTLREHRLRHQELSQQGLADLAGCTRQTIIALEQNKYLPSLLLARKLVHSFGCSVEELFQIEFE